MNWKTLLIGLILLSLMTNVFSASTLIGSISDQNYIAQIQTDEDYIYTIGWYTGLRAYDFNGTNFILKGSRNDANTSYAWASYHDGNYLYVSSQIGTSTSTRLRAYDFNGTDFILKGERSDTTNLNTIFGDGTYIYTSRFGGSAPYNNLKAFTFDGTTFTLKGDTNYNIGNGCGYLSATVSAGKIYAHTANGKIVFDFNGTNFNLDFNTSLPPGTCGAPAYTSPVNKSTVVNNNYFFTTNEYTSSSNSYPLNIYENTGSDLNYITRTTDSNNGHQIIVNGQKVFVGFWDKLRIFDFVGNILFPYETIDSNSITIALKGNTLFTNHGLYGLRAYDLDFNGDDDTPPVTTASGFNAGWNTTTLSIKLTCIDNNSGCRDKFYRLNSGAWITYEGEFGITDGNKLLEYYSTDWAENDENIKSVYLAQDVTNPSSNANGCTSGWNNTNQTASITGTDSVSGLKTIYVWDSNGTSLTSSTSPLSYLISTDGNHILTYQTKDNAGNKDANKYYSCAIDKTAPSIGQTTISGFSISGTLIWGTGTIIGAVPTDTNSGLNTTTCEYTINNGLNWITADWNGTQCLKTGITITVGQTPRFNMRIKDNATNQGTGTATIQYTADNNAPTTTFSGATGAWQKTTLSITLSCADAESSCANTYYKINNAGAYSTYSGAFGVSDGNNKIDYYSTDTAGNTETVKTNYASQDRVNPTTTGGITAGTTGSNGWYVGNVTYTITPADATSGVKFTYYCTDTTNTCTPTTTYSSAITLSTESATNYVRFYSGDNADNNQTTQSSGAIKIDKTLPTTTLTQVNGTTGWNKINIDFTLGCSDSTSGCATTKYRLNSGSWITYSSQVTISTDLNHKIDYYSTDTAGQDNTTQTYYIAVDKTTPTTSGAITGGTLGLNSWYKTNVTYTLTTSDNLSGIATTQYCLDTTNACTPNLTYTPSITISTESATNYVRFRSTDNAGNVQTTQSSGAIKIDKTVPSVGTAQISGFTTYTTYIRGTGIVSATATDATSGVNTCEYTINGSTWLSADKNATHCYKSLTITNGISYTFNFRATDNATNVGTGTDSNTYTGDMSAPTTTMTYTIFTDTNKANVQLTCVDVESGCATTSYRINGGAWTAYTTDFNFIGLSQHTIDYNSTDKIGNQEITKQTNLNMPVLLTIKYPKNIATLIKLTEKWNLRSIGALTLNLTDLTTDYNTYVLPGILTTFYIGDVNGNYTESTFTKTYYNDSNTGYDTLQPYLYAINTSLSTIINVLNKNTLAPLMNYSIKFYGNLPGIGNTLIGQGTSDDKGQILQLFIAGQSYTWQVYDSSNTLLGTFNYTAINNSAYVYYNFLSIYVSSITPLDLNSNTDINGITNEFFGLRNTFFDTCTTTQPCFPSALIAIILTIIALITATSVSGMSGAFIGVKGLSVVAFCCFTIFFGIGWLPLFIYAFLGTITLLMAVLTQ